MAVQLWPTPGCSDQDIYGTAPEKRIKPRQGGESKLLDSAILWPTPTVCGDHNRVGLNDRSGNGLATEAKLWPTPGAGDDRGPNPRIAESAARHAENGEHKQIGLRDVVVLWPTPSARDFRDGRCGEETAAANSRPLNEFAVTLWATPSVSACKGGVPQDSKGKRDLRLDIQDFPSSLPDPPNSTPGEKSPPGILGLNPQFVDWLMGFPPGWTALDLGATQFALWERRTRSSLSAMRSEIEAREAAAPVQTSLFDFFGGE